MKKRKRFNVYILFLIFIFVFLNINLINAACTGSYSLVTYPATSCAGTYIDIAGDPVTECVDATDNSLSTAWWARFPNPYIYSNFGANKCINSVKIYIYAFGYDPKENYCYVYVDVNNGGWVNVGYFYVEPDSWKTLSFIEQVTNAVRIRPSFCVRNGKDYINFFLTEYQESIREYTSGPVCGDGRIDPPEICEPSTGCSQSTTTCSGYLTGTRDSLGNCISCNQCSYDPFSYSCVKGSCGATCAVNSDCPSCPANTCYSAAPKGTNTNNREYRNYNSPTCNSANCQCNTCTYTLSETDADGDNYDTQCDNDCNDNNANIHPGAAETCNGIDDNCNSQIDENACKVYFAEMRGNKIAQTDLNDRVKLIVEGIVNNGITYRLFNKDNNEIASSEIQTLPLILGQTYSYASWLARPSAEYYFTARMPWGTVYNTEGNTIVNERYLRVLNSETNSPPVANIDIPKTGDVYLKAASISFRQTSYDTDDFINYLWSFGDLNSIGGSTRDYLNYNTMHTYTQAGQKSINLSVIDERGLRDFDIASILIIDPSINGIYVFANISKPNFGQVLSSSNSIDFDASGSFALQVTASPLPLTYTCLGGDCPLTINGVSVGSGNGARGNYNPLNFSWKFDDGISITKKADKLYRRGFSLPGVHFANLTVLYGASGDKSSAITVFTITPGLNPCQNGNTEFWIGSTRYSTLLTNDKCKGLDNEIETPDDCCPAGYLCKINNTDTIDPKRAVCQPDSNNIQYCQDKSSCGDYDQLHCVNPDICGLGGSGGGSESCGAAPLMDICGDGSFGLRQGANCRCEWNSDSGRCEQVGSIDISISGISIEGTCITDITNAGECEDGELSITQNSHMEWEQSDLNDLQLYLNTIGDSRTPEQWLLDNCQANLCFSGTRQLICGENTIRLSFFNWINTLIAIVLIVVVYVIGIRRLKIWHLFSF